MNCIQLVSNLSISTCEGLTLLDATENFHSFLVQGRLFADDFLEYQVRLNRISHWSALHYTPFVEENVINKNAILCGIDKETFVKRST